MALLFDLDGVLVDSREVWFHTMRAAARELGHPEPTRQAFDDSFGQGVAADVESFYPGVAHEALDAFYDEHFRDHLEHFLVTPGAPELLGELRARGVPHAVVTNTSRPLALEILQAARLEPEHLVGSTDVARAKPAPDMVLRGCELTGAAPGEAWMVGDSEYDREAARAAGVRFAGYWGIPGDRQLGSLAEVLGLLG